MKNPNQSSNRDTQSPKPSATAARSFKGSPDRPVPAKGPSTANEPLRTLAADRLRHFETLR